MSVKIIIVLTIIMMIGASHTVSGIDVKSCDECHGRHSDCGDCHGDDHHRDYPHNDCFDCHGDSNELHHKSSAFNETNCTFCHEVYTIQSVPHFPEEWRECDNCHEVDHHRKGAEDNCSTCHVKEPDKEPDKNCEYCHRNFPTFERDWDGCDNCHSRNKHSNCDDCHSDVDHHKDVKGQCSECHEGGKDSEDDDKGKSGGSGGSGGSSGSKKGR